MAHTRCSQNRISDEEGERESIPTDSDGRPRSHDSSPALSPLTTPSLGRTSLLPPPSPLAISHSLSGLSESVRPAPSGEGGGQGGGGAEAREILGRERAMTTLGKRHRTNSSLRRTTSMSGFAVPAEEAGRQPTRVARGASAAPATGWGGAAAVQRRHSGDFQAAMETAAFLKACGLCRRRLGPGRDTFIYMGEVAFCSLECRQQQMNLVDELKENKCFPPAGSGSDGTSSTVAAA